MRIIFVVSLVVVLSFSGCKRNDATRNQNGFTNGFAKQMDDGKTTRDQEQKFIRASANLSYEVDRSVRGKKKADATKAAAIAGPQDSAPAVNLDKP